MTNIYVRQMQQLGLNPKQYAELIEIPYGVVKNFIYGKEGDYEMGLGDLLRRNMLQKHQDIEENFEEAKLKATEIKYKDGSNVRDWYENEYTPELLLNTLGLRSRKDFERNYDIMVDGSRASHWFYVCITGKTNYDNHEVRKDVQDQFIEQLYDILVNNNIERYKREEPTEVKIFPSQRRPIKNKGYKNKYFKWFREFDIKQFIKEQGLTQVELATALHVGTRTVNDLVNQRHYTKRTLQKLYDYVSEVKNNNNVALTNYENNETFDLENWYNNFDFKTYFEENNLKQCDIYPALDIDRSTFNQIVNHIPKCYDRRSREKIQRLYDYLFKDKEPIIEFNDDEEETTQDTIYVDAIDIDDKNDEIDENDVVSNNSTSEKVDNHTPQMVSNNDNNNTNNDILRKLLANRLTEEERELIKIFGGVID